MIYGYARVSTRHQKLDTQIRDLKQAGVEKVYSEKYTGTTVKRPEFEKLMNKLQKGDTLIVCKLDRLARNTREALDTVQNLFDRGVRINILNMGVIDNTPTGRLTLTIFSAFAEFERDLIVARTQEGKEFARQNDPHYKDGRPRKYTDEQIKLAFHLYHDEGKTHRMVERATGMPIPTQKYLFKKLQLN